MNPEELAALRGKMEEARDQGAIYTMQQIAETLRLLAEIERLTKIAAAERALRLAINDMVRALSDGGRLNAATARASEAAAALRALGIEP